MALAVDQLVGSLPTPIVSFLGNRSASHLDFDMAKDETRMICTFYLTVTAATCLYGWYAFYTVLDCFPSIFNKYRTQKDKPNPNLIARRIMLSGILGGKTKAYAEKVVKDYGENASFKADAVTFVKTFWHMLTIHFITAPGMWYLGLHDIACWKMGDIANFVNPENCPPLAQFALHIFIFSLCEDTMFYWSHRTLHIGPLYRAIHKKHHEHHKPISLGSEYAHPIEIILGNYGPLFLGPFFFGTHIYEICFWILVRLTQSVEHHSGYTLPVVSIFSHLSPICMPSRMHDYHHSNNRGSFGSFYMFWDKICGTDGDYMAHEKKIAAAEEKNKAK